MERGCFFSFDGIDGTGKTTQVERFCEWLRDRGHEVVFCRDPGTTPLGEDLRNIVLHTESAVSSIAETLIYMAARAQLVEEIILPALQAGQIVVSDRFLLATIAYQGHGLGMPVDPIRQVGAVATQGCMPTATFVLDLDPEIAAQRLGSKLDRLERRDAEYHQRVREGFLHEASQSPTTHVIHANTTIEEIQNEIRQIAEPLLARLAPQ